ncbi:MULTISPECIES: ATP-dependent helicase [unclassified Helicobacter]|uniref:ATP-dependent helicase n=1 Tax=unclassified Helicobacter TaxID=2593540 RepID=UPI001F58A727|nr:MULTISPECIES: ATP-dependent helicase [unclassified Helicobacter]MCI2236316.1 ATP-dependent helicase [Helicobacter sp. CaF467b]MCI7046928.1 ATP-dependent helicase [Helicobacter sp.]MCI7765915.1 ATP-dependent helicase [Helicobacter sp.]
MPLSKLNDQQREASLAPSGHNLIIASAGTGKTSTIVGRISHLLESGILPNEILLLTFTNKAAQEMLNRLELRFDSKIVKQIEAGTFHAVAYRYLKNKNSIILKQPRELKVLFKSLYDKRIFTHISQTPPYGANYLYDIFSLFQNATISDDFLTWLQNRNSEQAPYVEIYLDVWEEFKNLKKEYHYADYNDLLLFYKEEVAQDKLCFKEILVDEYQDTNPLQDSILQTLNPPSIFCVGDYDQSIYAFNGADISIIGSFKDRYPNGNIYSLTKNYRSTAPILNLANRVIEKNPRIYPKTLEVVKTQNFGMPTLLVYDELFLQYQGIANKIKLSNRPYKDVAVIFRNNSSADGIEASLREVGIPTRRKGGVSFFDSKEVAYILNLCSLLYNPKDMMSFIHVLSHAKGIGNAMAKDIYEALLILGEGNAIKGLLKPNQNIKEPYKKITQNTQLGLFDEFFAMGNVERFSYLESDFKHNSILSHPKLTKEGAEFLDSLYFFFNSFNMGDKPAFLIGKIIQLPIFKKVAQKLAKERSINKDGRISEEKFQESLERIERKMFLLRDLASHYQEIGRFLNAMMLGSSEMSEGEGVNLLSIHASKGLEFSEVYIVDLMEGRFPNKKLMNQSGSLEEERRLFYVAVTRAKENLYLSYAKKDVMRNISYEGSIFLYEAGLLHKGN